MHVKLLANCPPCGSSTPHCLSTSTGAFGFDALALASSFFFFFFVGAPSSVSSAALRFLLAAPPLTALLSPSSSSSLSWPYSFLAAASRASLASFFLRCFSCFLLRQPSMCLGIACSVTVRLQWLHFSIFGVSIKGRPVWKAFVMSEGGRLTKEGRFAFFSPVNC